MGLGFTPLYSAGLSLIANTAPVAYGAIGTPILTLGAVTGIPADAAQRDGGTPVADRVADRPGVAGRDDERVEGLRGVWPAVLVSGGSFAIVQFLWSNYVGPELVDIIGGLVSLGCLARVLHLVAAGGNVGISRRATAHGAGARRLDRCCRRQHPPAVATLAASIRAPGCRGSSCRCS